MSKPRQSRPANPIRTGEASLKPGNSPGESWTFSAETFLQRIFGNRFVSRDEQVVQTKLRVGDAHDEYEREADRVAEHVMSMSLPAPPPEDVTPSGPTVQRQCDICHREDEVLQRKTKSPGSADIAPAVSEGGIGLNGGQPLSRNTRSYFEPRFGFDFSDVRVHTGPQADALSGGFNAKAFTYGNNIVFAEGEYRPQQASGQRLLAHELTHVVQQTGAEKRISRSPASKNRRSLIPNISRVTGNYVQRMTATCRRLLRRGFLSDIAVGNAVEREIQNDFERRLGPRYIFDVESGTSAPYREHSGTEVTPQVFDVPHPRSGVGSPDIAYKSRTGAAMLVAEIKPANWGGVLLGESQLANYIAKGNSDENADLRARLGVRTISPMIGRGRFRTPRYVTALGQRYRVIWCGPGLILYSGVSKKKKKKKKKTKTKKKLKKKVSGKKKVTKKKTGRRAGSAGYANFGLGISIGSFGVGAGNAGIGVSIFSEGASAGTVSAGIVYNSQGVAVGSISAGAAVDSEGAAAGTAGAGLSEESSTAAAGAAGAGHISGSTVAGAGVAGAGTMRDTTGAAAGQAASGERDGGTVGEQESGGDAGAESASGTRTGEGGAGGDRESGEPASGSGGSGRGATAGEDREGLAGTGPAGGTGQAEDRRLAEIVARLQLDSSTRHDTQQLKRALIDADRLDRLVQNATPAQRVLLQALARSNETGTYYVPSPEWVQMMLLATQGISEEDLEYLMRLDWNPANVTQEELRQAILAALAQRVRDTPPPSPPPQRHTSKKKTKKKKRLGKKKRSRTREGSGGGSDRDRDTATGGGERDTGTEREGRRSRFAGISAARIADALRGQNWDAVGRGDVRINLGQGILYGRTENGTSFGAFIALGQIEHEGRQVTVINDASDIVAIDQPQSGDGISLISSTGEVSFIFFAGLTFGGGESTGPDSVVSGGDVLLGLQIE